MGDGTSCIKKLTKWLTEHPNYTFDDVIKATKAYIDSFQGSFTYIMRADYFIYKHDESTLSACIDDDEKFTKDDWTKTLI